MNRLVENLAIVLSLFFNCNQKNNDFPPEGDKRCKVETKLSYRNGTLNDRWVYEYDDNFNLKRGLNYKGDSDDASVYHYEYKFNDKGQTIEQVAVNENEVVTYADFKYHSNGQLEFKKEYDKNYQNHGEYDHTAEYDDRGNIIRSLTILENNATTEDIKTYNSDDKVVNHHTIIYLEGRLNTEFETDYVYENGLLKNAETIGIFPKKGRVNKSSREYNGVGKLIMYSTYPTHGPATFEKYDYDSLGLLVKKTRYSEKDSVKLFTNYEYDKNNLLVRESYGNSSKSHWIVNEFEHFANGKLKRYVSYFETLNVLSMDKKPQSVSVYDERGNQVESSVYDISGEKIRFTTTTYICRD